MPKSKRDRKVALTKTVKKGIEVKKSLVDEIRKSVDTYERIFVFNVHNMRNNKLKDVRSAWKHSRFFFGKNKVMALALGKTPESEYRENLYKISSRLNGEVGLLFTTKTEEEVLEWFDNFKEFDYSKSGNIATSTVVLKEGEIKQFSHALEPHLRKIGLPVALKKGIVTLLQDYTVCKEGDQLTPEQAQILKHFKIMMSEFSLVMEYVWDKTTGVGKVLEQTSQEKTFNEITVDGEDIKYDFINQDEK